MLYLHRFEVIFFFLYFFSQNLWNIDSCDIQSIPWRFNNILFSPFLNILFQRLEISFIAAENDLMSSKLKWCKIAKIFHTLWYFFLYKLHLLSFHCIRSKVPTVLLWYVQSIDKKYIYRTQLGKPQNKVIF